MNNDMHTAHKRVYENPVKACGFKRYKHEITGETWVCGDVHAELSMLQYGLMRTLRQRKMDAKLSGKPVAHANVILLGDVGLGFPDDPSGDRLLHKMSKLAGMFNATLYLIRGNHDNPLIWRSETAAIGMSVQRHPNVYFLSDGMLRVNKDKYMVLGGGTSVDKSSRIENRDWWPGEGIGMDTCHLPYGAFSRGSDLAGILSHVGPRPPLVNPVLPSIFYDMQEEVDREQALLRSIGDIVHPKRWYFGHYHDTHRFNTVFCTMFAYDEWSGDTVMTSNPVYTECDCLCLGIAETYKISNG